MSGTTQSASTFARREIVPKGFPLSSDVKLWESNAPTDVAQQLVGRMQQWFAHVRNNEKLFKQHIYDNPNPGTADFLQHRARLAALIGEGDKIALDFSAVESSGVNLASLRPTLQKTMVKTDALVAEFVQWHAPVMSDPNVPETFKRGFLEIFSGKHEEAEY